MLLDNNKKILIYGFDKEDKSLIEKIVDTNELPKYSVMNKSMSQMKIRDIIDGFNLQVLDNSLPEERVILFNNLCDDELERAVKAIRNAFEEPPILAVVTPISIEWTLEALIDHLVEERNWFKEHRR
jgi:hypothetical protein